MLDAIPGLPADTVVHGDLGPDHVLVEGDRLTGVIDFGDAHVGDPAIDLAWALYGTPAPFRHALAESYGVTPEERERALLWHRLGPWFEVVHGRMIADDNLIRGGLAGVLARLTTPRSGRRRTE
ncbi:phosphotransferase [Nocardia sp. NPDC003482]